MAQTPHSVESSRTTAIATTAHIENKLSSLARSGVARSVTPESVDVPIAYNDCRIEGEVHTDSETVYGRLIDSDRFYHLQVQRFQREMADKPEKRREYTK